MSLGTPIGLTREQTNILRDIIHLAENVKKSFFLIPSRFTQSNRGRPRARTTRHKRNQHNYNTLPT